MSVSFLTDICRIAWVNFLKYFFYKSGHILLLLTDTVEKIFHEYKQEQVFSSWRNLGLCFFSNYVYFQKYIGCVVMKEHEFSSKTANFF